MSTVEEYILKIPRLYRILIVVGVACLLFVGYYFLSVADWVARVQGTESQIKVIENDIKNEENIARKRPELKVKIDKLEKDLKVEVASLPDQQDIEQLLKKITELVSETNLVNNKFTPLPETKNENLYFAEIPISCEVTGTYVQQYNFLTRLYAMERIFNVHRLSLRKGGRMPDRGSAVVGISALDADVGGKTFRRLTDVEIAAIQAKKRAGQGGGKPAGRHK